MPTPTPTDRLPRLREALVAYEPGQRASLAELAAAYGVATNRFTTLIKSRFPGFPPAQREADKSHSYEAIPAIRSMISYIEEPDIDRRRKAARVAAVLGNQPAASEDVNEDPPPSAADLDRMANVAIKTWRLQRDKGLYVLKTESAAQARRAYHTFMRAITGLRIRIDPNGDLPPKVSARIDGVLRSIVEDVVKELSGPAGIPPGTEDEGDDVADRGNADASAGGAGADVGGRKRATRRRR